MNEFENQIYQVIANSAGIKGHEIADELGVDKKTVNSTLANSAALKAVVRQDTQFRWHTVTHGETEPDSQPTPDPQLRSICNYYLNCLALESSNSVSQFLSSNYELKYAVLNGLEIGDGDSDAVRLLNRIDTGRDTKAYFGYPSMVFTIHSERGSFKKIAPVFLFSVDNAGGRADISRLPSINMEVMKAYSSGGSESIAAELVALESELGMNVPDADIDMDELVLRLKAIRQWNWAEEIDPYLIPAAADLSNFEDGIYNRPVIIEAERTKYTEGLESELMILANMPEENYRGTALHAWVKGDFSSRIPEKAKPLLEVLPLNSEQALSVETAMASDLTIVTGPPGTGKSQVVTDLLVNIAWNGKSALFSSKNNKAVDVVEARVNGLCKRPMLLRIGGNQCAGRLAEIIEGLLAVRQNHTNSADLEYYLSQYNGIVAQSRKFQKIKDEIVKARNELDETEQRYCTVRSTIEKYFDLLDASDIGKISLTANSYLQAYHQALKENNGFFARLFWFNVRNKRLAARSEAAKAFNLVARKYGLRPADDVLSPEEVKRLVFDAEKFDAALRIGIEYKRTLEKFHAYETLENVDQKLSESKASAAQIAYKLWDKWLTSQAVTFSAEERQEMANYVAAMKLVGGAIPPTNKELSKQFKSMSQRMTRYLQCWAVTSLSAKSRIPFEAGVFDYVIIDEASQCDIASILPLLFRAKHAVIIGDPQQLSHISQLTRQQDLALLQRYAIPPMWSYSVMSLYALAEAKVDAKDIVQLKDHFRSCADIIEFSNEVFYDGSLRTATKYTGLRPPNGETPGIRWIDVRGRTIRPRSGSAYNSAEAEAIVKELKRLVDSGYEGTMGVTTPFREQAEKIKSILERSEPETYDKLLKRHEFIADTVHKFQGDERDLMIFSTVVTPNAPPSTVGFLNSTGNLFNVAITRARAVLVIVGDYHFCSQCGVSYLKRFAEYYGKLNTGTRRNPAPIAPPTSREYPWVDNPEQVSDWERMFYTALFDAGIVTIPQYPVEKYKLDLAIIQSNGRKLDIEVDGAMYHRSWNGELCYRDQLRNQRMFELGWDVKRFWVYQLRDELPWCIEQIRKWQNNVT